jgi:hypothetical protein
LPDPTQELSNPHPETFRVDAAASKTASAAGAEHAPEADHLVDALGQGGLVGAPIQPRRRRADPPALEAPAAACARRRRRVQDERAALVQVHVGHGRREVAAARVHAEPVGVRRVDGGHVLVGVSSEPLGAQVARPLAPGPIIDVAENELVLRSPEAALHRGPEAVAAVVEDEGALQLPAAVDPLADLDPDLVLAHPAPSPASLVADHALEASAVFTA